MDVNVTSPFLIYVYLLIPVSFCVNFFHWNHPSENLFYFADSSLFVLDEILKIIHAD